MKIMFKERKIVLKSVVTKTEKLVNPHENYKVIEFRDLINVEKADITIKER